MTKNVAPMAALTWFFLSFPGHAGAVPTREKGNDSAPQSAILPGGVADAEGKTGYLPNTQGGIDAVDLATGRLLWASKAGAKPLAYVDHRLVAQAGVQGKNNAIRIVVLDPGKKGKLDLESKPIVFPEWVSVEVTHGRSFTAEARTYKNQQLLFWDARAWYAGGARPTPEIERRARQHASGVAQVDLKTGRVVMLDKGDVPTVASPKLPNQLAKVTSHQYWTGSGWETKPLIVGNRLAALIMVNDQGKMAARLKMWDLKSVRLLGDVSLLQGKSLWPQLSLDKRYLLIHQAVPKEALPEGDYAFWVFSLATGKQVAKIPFEPGNQRFTILGPRAFHVVEVSRGGPRGFTRTRTLKAIDLKSGKVAWQRPIWAPPPLLPLP